VADAWLQFAGAVPIRNGICRLSNLIFFHPEDTEGGRTREWPAILSAMV